MYQLLFIFLILLRKYCAISLMDHIGGRNRIASDQEISNMKSSCCFYYYNSIECNCENEESLLAEINKLSEDVEGSIKLLIKNTNFLNKTFADDWLSQLNETIELRKFEIANTNIGSIPSQFFTRYPFKELQYLGIIDLEIEILRKDSFAGMKNLEEFTFKNNEKFRFLHIESGVFEDARTLTELEFVGCINTEEQLTNLTGSGNILGSLKILDLSFNHLTNLPKLAFSSAPKLNSAFFSSNHLKNIDVDAFKGVKVQLIYLNSNQLEWLPENVFTYIDEYTTVYLQDNPWKCECNLKWLQDEYLRNKSVIAKGEDKPYCDNDRKTSFDLVDFCKNSSSESTTEGEMETNWQTITCKSAELKQNKLITEPVQFKSETSEVKFLSFTFHETSAAPELILEISGDPTDMHLIFFEDIFNATEAHCVTNLKSSIALKKLRFNQVYTICLVKKDEVLVPLQSCLSLKTPLMWADQSWITNEYQLLVITLIPVGLLISMMIGMFITYVVIRKCFPLELEDKKQNFVRGDLKIEKNVNQTYLDATVTSQSGYVTPHFYEKINYPKASQPEGAMHRFPGNTVQMAKYLHVLESESQYTSMD